MKIVKVKKDSYGDIQQVMFDNGQVASVDKAIKWLPKARSTALTSAAPETADRRCVQIRTVIPKTI
jgi:hypothetical protein